jgi:predicted N-formylglutamate amidohydrolase
MQLPLTSLLGPGDPPPFSVHNEKGKAPLLLLCDHASKAVPKALGTLGITDAELSQHVG